MGLDDVTRTLKLDNNDWYLALIQTLISVNATNKALVEIIGELLADGDPNEKQKMFRNIEKLEVSYRNRLIEGLYVRYGGLPPGIEELFAPKS